MKEDYARYTRPRVSICCDLESFVVYPLATCLFMDYSASSKPNGFLQPCPIKKARALDLSNVDPDR